MHYRKKTHKQYETHQSATRQWRGNERQKWIKDQLLTFFTLRSNDTNIQFFLGLTKILIPWTEIWKLKYCEAQLKITICISWNKISKIRCRLKLLTFTLCSSQQVCLEECEAGVPCHDASVLLAYSPPPPLNRPVTKMDHRQNQPGIIWIKWRENIDQTAQ